MMKPTPKFMVSCSTCKLSRLADSDAAETCEDCGGRVSYEPISTQSVDQANDETALVAEVADASPLEQRTLLDSTSSVFQGRYVLGKVLGEGAFGKVYLAYDNVLDRDVAIKVPRLETSLQRFKRDKQVQGTRFFKEARAAARLRHPNIVSVFDYGHGGQELFIVYEFVPGRTLDRYLKTEQPPLELVLDWMIQVAEALAYAANEGIVHRDIKPANIMIDGRNRSQIMDFGLAEAIIEGKIHTKGRISGTPAYMSPEQARGEQHIGPATDQYALGAILYECATGKRAARGSGLEVLADVARREHPPLEPLSLLPKDLQMIILKAMNREPSQRYSTCMEFAEDLKAFRANLPVQANPVGLIGRLKKWTHRNRSLAAALAALFSVTMSVFMLALVAAVAFKVQNDRLAKANSDASASELNAKEKADLAEINRQAADSAKQEAEMALRNESQTREALQRTLDDLIAQREKTEKAEAVAEIAATQQQLAEADKVQVSEELEGERGKSVRLRYQDSMRLALNSLVAGEPLQAMNHLNSSDANYRAWEHSWLIAAAHRLNTATSEARRRPVETPLESLPGLKFHEQVLNTLGIPMYDVVSQGGQLVVEQDPRRIYGNPLGDFAMTTIPGPVSTGLVRIHTQTGVATPVASYLKVLAIELLDEGRIAVVTTIAAPGNNGDLGGKDVAVPRVDVWSLASKPEKLFSVEIEGDGWIPSHAYFNKERGVLFQASGRSWIRAFRIENGELLSDFKDLPIQFAKGPNALQVLADERLAFLDGSYRLRSIHIRKDAVNRDASVFQTAEWRAQFLPWHTAKGFRCDYTWSGDGRFVAVCGSPPATDGAREDLDSRIEILDAISGTLLVNLPRPYLEYRSQMPNQRGDLVRRNLYIHAILVNDQTNTVSVRDSSGAIWSWSLAEHSNQQLAANALAVEFKLGGPLATGDVDLTLAATDDEHLLVVNDKNLLSSFSLTPEGPKFKKSFRRNGGRTLQMIDPILESEGACVVEQEGSVRLLGQNAVLFEAMHPGVTSVDYAGGANGLVCGTSNGEVVIMNETNGELRSWLTKLQVPIVGIQYLADRNQVLTVSQSGGVRIWSASGGHPISPDELLLSFTPLVVFADKAHNLLAVGGSQEIAICEFDERAVIRLRGIHALGYPARYGQFLSEGKRLVVSDGQRIALMDCDECADLFQIPYSGKQVQALGQCLGSPYALDRSGTITWWPGILNRN